MNELNASLITVTLISVIVLLNILICKLVMADPALRKTEK